MDQRSTSAAASQVGDRPFRSARGRSCSYCGPARSRSCAGFSHACATDALCCVPYVVTLLAQLLRLGTVAVTTPSLCTSFIPAPVPFLNRRAHLYAAHLQVRSATLAAALEHGQPI